MLVTRTQAAEPRRARRNFAGAERRIVDGARFLGSWTYAPVPVTPITSSPSLPAELPNVPTYAQIKALEQAVVDHLPPVDLEPVHYFADGMYGRELFIAAGTVVVGKMHRHQHLVQLLSGEATVWTDRGMERIRGPKTWVSPPGVKRALLTHTDCLFFTFHLNATNTTDLAAIEEYVIVPEPQLEHDATEHDAPALPADFADELQRVYA